MDLADIFGDGTDDKSEQHLDLVEQVDNTEVIELPAPTKKHKKNRNKHNKGGKYDLPSEIKDIKNNTIKLLERKKTQKQRYPKNVWAKIEQIKVLGDGTYTKMYHWFEGDIPNNFLGDFQEIKTNYLTLYNFVLEQQKSRRIFTRRTRQLGRDRAALAIQYGLYSVKDIENFMKSNPKDEFGYPVEIIRNGTSSKVIVETNDNRERTTIHFKTGESLTGMALTEKLANILREEHNNIEVRTL